MQFQDKVILITWASRWIWKATALEFAKEWAKVIINYFSSEKEAINLVDEIKKIGSDAIAIKSTISRLLNSFNEENELHQYVGTVKYHDGIKYSFRGNMFDPVMYKWNYYQFENELRIVTPFRAKNFDALKTHPNGVTPIVNTGELIDKIYLSPNASQEHFEKVNQLLKEHNLKKDIYFSGINEKWNNSKI